MFLNSDMCNIWRSFSFFSTIQRRKVSNMYLWKDLNIHYEKVLMRCFWNSGFRIKFKLIFWNATIPSVKWAFSFLNPLARHNHCKPLMASLSRRCLWIVISIKIFAILMATSIITTPLMMPSPIGHFHPPFVDAQIVLEAMKAIALESANESNYIVNGGAEKYKWVLLTLALLCKASNCYLDCHGQMDLVKKCLIQLQLLYLF